jgi:hypothetical protein
MALKDKNKRNLENKYMENLITQVVLMKINKNHCSNLFHCHKLKSKAYFSQSWIFP